LQEPPCTATNVTPADTGVGKDQTPQSKGHRLPTLKLANPFSKKKVSSEIYFTHCFSKVKSCFIVNHTGVLSIISIKRLWAVGLLGGTFQQERRSFPLVFRAQNVLRYSSYSVYEVPCT
jgi:hypothetical protein